MAMYVLGAGSLGCLWAAHLAKSAACHPTLLLRAGSAKLRHLKDGRVRLRVIRAERVLEVEVGAEEVNRSPATSDIHQLLLVTKAPAAREALLQVAPRLAAGAVVIILCNGALALHEEISEMPASQRWHLMCGLTTHGAWSKADFEVVHAGAGDTIFGQYGAVRMSEETYESTLAQLLAAGLGGRHEAHIERSLWLKLAANAAINPLTALLEKNNGCILEEEQISRCKEICKEVAAVAAASWHQQGFASLCPSAAEMEDFALDTARRTSPNRSSMLQDVLAERPTEIDYLNGWLVTKARTFGLEVAENAQLTALIKEKERRFLEPKAADAGKEVSDSNAPVVLKSAVGRRQLGKAAFSTQLVGRFTMAPKEIIKKIGEDGFDMEEFKAQVYKEGCKKLHIVDVYTAWCGPCLSIVPTFKNLQMNIDYFEDRCTITQAERTCLPEFEERFPETSKPRFLFYKEGEEVMQIEGLKAPEILKFIEENLPAIETEE
ncbi:2-dehydropantoate 2-reductase (Ketopantoate reductase) (KPR) [Durusdinium trenchii]